MPTKSKIRTTIELNPGDKERLQSIAFNLGIIQSTGPDAGKIGSISQLMQVIAADLLAFEPGKAGRKKETK